MNIKHIKTAFVITILSVAGAAAAATPAQINAIVERFQQGSGAVVSAYEATALRIGTQTVNQIQSARTVDAAIHASNRGRTDLSVAKGRAADDKEKSDLDSLRDHERRAADELKAIGASTSNIGRASAAQKAALKRILDAQIRRVRDAESARRSELRR